MTTVEEIIAMISLLDDSVRTTARAYHDVLKVYDGTLEEMVELLDGAPPAVREKGRAIIKRFTARLGALMPPPESIQ